MSVKNAVKRKMTANETNAKMTGAIGPNTGQQSLSGEGV